VFETPRHQREKCVSASISSRRLPTRSFLFSIPKPAGWKRSEGFALLPEVEQPAGAFYVTKTACDSFYNTGLAALLREQDINAFVICGCATDYCVDATIKNGEPRLSHYRRGRCPYHRKSPGGAGANPD
jgi:nicotinamidase-related amidase